MDTESPKTPSTLPPVWDERGVYLQSLEIMIEAAAPAEAWRKFIRETNMRLDEKEPDDPRSFAAASFAAFPQTVNSGEKYISGNLHPNTDQPTDGDCVAHLHFFVNRAPSSDPPKNLVSLSERAGGMVNLLKTMRTHWPARGTPSLDVRGTYLINETDRLTPALSAVAPGGVITTQQDGVGHQLRATFSVFSWTVDPPIGPVSNMTLTVASQDPEPGQFVMLMVSGSMYADITQDILDQVDGALWQGILPFLKNSTES